MIAPRILEIKLLDGTTVVCHNASTHSTFEAAKAESNRLRKLGKHPLIGCRLPTFTIWLMEEEL